MQEKIEKNLFVFEIIASKLVALSCLYVKKRILPSAVNVLTNTYKALHQTKTDFLRLNYLQNDH